MTSLRWWSFALLVIAVAAGASWALQRHSAAALRQEVALLRDENRILAQLRVENQRLRSQQVPAPELQRLQADRAAIQRLRVEIEALQTRTDERARHAPITAPAPRAPLPPPALALSMRIDSGRTLMVDGQEVDLALLRERLARIGEGERVDVELAVPHGRSRADSADVTQRMKDLMGVARELGLKMSISLKPDPQTITADAPR